MKNVCLLNDSFPPILDGVSNAVVNYAKVLHERGSQVCVVTPENPQVESDDYAFPVFRYPGVDLSKKIGYVMGNPFSAPELKKIKKQKLDILHSHCPAISNMVAMELRASLNIPMVLTYHTKFDIEIRKAIKSELFAKGAMKALVDSVSSCDELWVVSKGAGESLRSLGYKGDYIVMPNGVDMKRHLADEDLVRSVTSNMDLPQGVPVLLFVGRLMWYKGIRLILDALAALKSQNIDFRMVFVGKGQDETEIKAYAKERGLGDRCFFAGPVYDREALAAWYTSANLFLFPSTFDTNGLVVREAAACSLGSVLVKDSCASEGITDGVDGLLVEENAASLAVCLARILDRPDAMRRIGENAAQNIYISWDDAISRAIERYEIVYDNFRSGKYPKHNRPMEGFFTFFGKMLGI